MNKMPKADPSSTANTPDAPRTRGRPRDPGLRGRIIEIARAHFAAQGFDGASLDRIAAAAGTSRVTVYSYFETKEGLFKATATEPLERVFKVDTEALDPLQPQRGLAQLGKAYLQLMLDPGAVANSRLLYGGGPKHPELTQSFYQSGPQLVADTLASYLAKVHKAQVLKLPNVDQAAEQFLALVRGNEQVRALLNLAPAREGAAATAYLKSCVDLFVKGYAR